MAIELSDVIQANIDRNLNRLYTSMPAFITDVSKLTSDNVISVQPAIQKVLSDGTSYNVPVLLDIPVQWGGGGGAVLTFPLKVGDDVNVFFAMVSTAEWWLTTGVSTPFDRRLHSLSDAFVMPKLFRQGDNPEPHADDVEIKYGDAKVAITKDGDINIQNANGNYNINADGTHSGNSKETWSMTNGTGELVDLLTQTLQALSDTTVNTVYGASPLNNKPTIDALITQLESFKE